MDQITKQKPFVTPLVHIKSEKGDVKHGIKSSEKSFYGFGEAYFSSVNYQMIKGWKLHRDMTLNLIVPHGNIRIIVHDGKEKINRISPLIDIVLGNSNYSRLTIPPGFWVAFEGVGEGSNLLLNVASIEHDPSEAKNKPLDYFKIRGFAGNE